MRYLRTVASFVKWIVFALIVWVTKFLACIVAPVAVLPIFVRKGTWDGRQCEELIPFWKWIATHDAPVDIYAYGTVGRQHWLLKRFDVVNPDNNPEWLKYLNRLLWIWRNPAYVVADSLGYNQEGMEFLYMRDEGHLWDSGYPNFSFYLVENKDKKIGWMLEWQWYFYKQRCLEVYLGWKLFRNDANKRCMLVARITPFKKYDKKV